MATITIFTTTSFRDRRLANCFCVKKANTENILDLMLRRFEVEKAKIFYRKVQTDS